MVRALAIAAMLAGVIVACSFKGPALGLGGGDAGLVDAALDDGKNPPPFDAHVDASPNPTVDASVVDARPLDAAAMPDSKVDGGFSSDLCLANLAACTAKNGTCTLGACVITQVTGGPVVCPAGMPCVIDCMTNGVCQANIDCGAATSCTVHCNANNTCMNQIVCPSGASDSCTIYCNANNTCMNVTLVNGSGCTYHCCTGNNSFCTNDNWSTCTQGSTTCP